MPNFMALLAPAPAARPHQNLDGARRVGALKPAGWIRQQESGA
jgi:hypothetical protein